jgi:hypothetical protein
MNEVNFFAKNAVIIKFFLNFRLMFWLLNVILQIMTNPTLSK